MTPKDLLDAALDLEYFNPQEGEAAIPYVRGHGRCPIVVVVGDNAGGKSFFRRVIQALCSRHKVECMSISMEGRRRIAEMPWLTLVYGDESHDSTGKLSIDTVLAGVESSKSRPNRHVVFWDEPDLGLSDGWAAGVGVKIRELARTASEHLVAAIVVTHSKALVRELLPARPHYLHLGSLESEAPPNLRAWVTRKTQPLEIEKLREMSHERFRKIQKVLNAAKP